MARSGSEYGELNKELFAQRNHIHDQLQELEDQPSHGPAEVREKKRLESELDLIKYRLVKLNQGLVGEYCRQFSTHSPHLADDFFAAGYVGLMSAVNSYDLDKGASFSHWAYRMIQREVLTEVRRLDHPTIGQSDFEKRQAILKVQHELEVENPDRVITEYEVAKKVGVSAAQARRVMSPTRVLSIDKPTETGDSESTAELVESIPNKEESTESQVIDHMDNAALAIIAREVLTPREHFVIVRRFGLDGEPAQTLASVGELLKLSRESVRNVQVGALEKLSSPSVAERLVSEVGISQEIVKAHL